jgi:hypothetical protein
LHADYFTEGGTGYCMLASRNAKLKNFRFTRLLKQLLCHKARNRLPENCISSFRIIPNHYSARLEFIAPNMRNRFPESVSIDQEILR